MLCDRLACSHLNKDKWQHEGYVLGSKTFITPYIQ